MLAAISCRVFFLSKNIRIKIYRTMALPVALYGSETWSLTLREERRLRVFENRVLMRIFGPERDEVMVWRKLRNEDRTDLYCSPNIIWVMKSRILIWAGNVARKGRGKVHIGFWCGNQRERDYWEGPRCRWQDIIKMDLQEVGYRGMDWIDLARDRDRWPAVVNLRVP